MFIAIRTLLQKYIEVNRVYKKNFLHVIPVRIIVPWFDDIKTIHRDVPASRNSNGDILSPIFRNTDFSFDNWKTCDCHPISSGKLPESLKQIDLTPVQEQ